MHLMGNGSTGRGAITIWQDVRPEARADFFAWHNQEHIPERVGIPGFLRGRRYGALEGAPEFFTLYETAGPELHAMFHPLFLYPPDYVNEHDDEIAQEQKRAPTRSAPVEASIGRIDAIMQFDRRAGLARIKAPTLIVASDNDYITPSYHAEAIARAIPGSKLMVYRGGGHSLSKTRAAEFNKTVLEFLGSS